MSPTTAPFAERFATARATFGPLTPGLDPSSDLLVKWGFGDDAEGLERFVDVALEVAVGSVGIVKPQSAFYERLGWRGIRALDRLISCCRADGVLVLLDVKRGDVGTTNAAYADAYLPVGASLRADAITVSPYLGIDALEAFFDATPPAGAALFVVVRSTNPEGRALQEATTAEGDSVEASLLVNLAARNAAAAPGRVGPFGAVFGPTRGRPPGIDLREVGGLYLAPGLGAQGATPADVAECFADCPERVLPSASRSLLDAGPDVERLRDAVLSLAADVNAVLHAEPAGG